MRPNSMNPHRPQRGFILVTALVLLVALTLLVLSSLLSSNSNLHVVGNMQEQEESVAAAQQAVEQTLSNNFTASPTQTSVAVDINNDGVADYNVTVLKPVCKNSTPLANSTPNLPPECLSSGTASNTGIIGSNGQSLASAQAWCEAQLWEVQANAVSASGSGGVTAVHQGVTLNVPAGTGC